MELKRFSLQLQNVHPNVLAKHLHRSVLYQDKRVVVINKPYGVPVRGLILRCSPVWAGEEATGVLLLARSEETVEHILNLHRNNQVHRKFWVVTVGVPVPSEGVVDIPIIEREVTGLSHTTIRVLDSSSGCSLVELQPLTGVKHQMRVHMSLALACPILGDHKYSHWSKLAPQKLPERVLESLDWNRARSAIFLFICTLTS
ncbi:hypothetical protein INR49_029878 [Caranx melampygus]|nr:hypothetical protein INR49_029878 [Caranx melampygus]